MLVNLIRLYPDSYLHFINSLFTTVTPLEHFAVAEWRDAEAVLNCVYYFGDAYNVNYQAGPYRGMKIILILDS